MTQRLLGLDGAAADRRPWPRRALVALAVALAGGYATLALGPLAARSIFMLSFLAVALAGLYGGLGGGLVATVAGGVFAAWALLAPVATLAVAAPPDRLRLMAYLLSGVIISVLCETLHRAIRELIAREAALRESEESYRLLFDTLTELVYVYAADGSMLDVNEAVERTYGYARHELLGQQPTMLLDLERNDLPGVLAAAAAATRGEPQLLELWGRRRDGSSFPKEITLTHGRYFGREVLISVARDISARKEAEAALARSEEQLRQAQKMEAVGRLAGGVAHDFNNLLTAIRGNAELAALELPPGSPVHAEVEEIRATADRAASLTRQLLAFSRKQVRQPRVLDLNVVLAEMERMLRRVIGTDVELVTRTSPAPACVHADAGQMEQVILNLVVNARDALPRGGRVQIEIALEARPADAGGDAVVLTVRDNGSGIPADVLEHIFEPFFTTKGQGKGTGLGLSTVYGIVQQSGGDISVETAPGAGTCFRTVLPRAQGVPAVASSPRAAAVAGGTGTILLVEDDAEVRSLTERLLRRGGYHVLSATDGADALRLVQERSLAPDLLLTDVVMPEMSGPELAERLRRELPGLRVLFVSGYAPDSAPYAHVPPPGSALLEKPFTSESLLRHVAARIADRAA